MMSPCLIFRNRGAAATLLELSEQGRNRAKNPSALSKARDRSPAPINDRRRRRLLCRGAKESYSPCRSRVRVSSLSVCLAVKPVGEPDAVAPHVRFDDWGWETGRWPLAPSYRAHPRLYRLRHPADPGECPPMRSGRRRLAMSHSIVGW